MPQHSKSGGSWWPAGGPLLQGTPRHREQSPTRSLPGWTVLSHVPPATSCGSSLE